MALRKLLIQQGWEQPDSESFVHELASGNNQSKLSPADLAMLAHVRKLTQTPSQITIDDINRLHDAGFDDPTIHDICAITAYFAMVNRIADGLGVELEPRFRTSE